MSSKPSIPKGTRDFSTDEMLKREYIFESIKQVFKLYGYQPIETPAVENLNTLLGKYGEEGDKLLFRILNSGDFLSSVSDDELKKREYGRLSSLICEKGLRYDLTVPFARYVVQHRDEIIFPFKRYQIQPVWRADRPQKGRYREFFQCDVDVIGSDSLFNEVELIKIIDKVFLQLGIRIIIKINNRKLISGLTEIGGQIDKFTDLTSAIDQIEKIGIDASIGALRSKGATSNTINQLLIYLNLKGGNLGKLKELKKYFKNSKIGLEGVKELTDLFRLLKTSKIHTKIEFDLNLARGLNYYTGAIIEVKSKDVSIGSICGGGRYDNLTGVFGMEGVSGVGISFGADRIYDVMNQLNLFNEIVVSSTDVLVLNFGEKEMPYSLRILDLLHDLNVCSELYPDAVKLKKQMSYADSKKIPFIIIAGENEINKDKVTIKHMYSGKQMSISFAKLDSYIINKIKQPGDAFKR